MFWQNYFPNPFDWIKKQAKKMSLYLGISYGWAMVIMVIMLIVTSPFLLLCLCFFIIMFFAITFLCIMEDFEGPDKDWNWPTEDYEAKKFLMEQKRKEREKEKGCDCHK